MKNKSFQKSLVGLFFLIVFTFLVSIPVLTLASNDPIPTTIKNPINVNTINDFIKILLEGVIKIGIPIVALMLIYSGFLFVFAVGNGEKLKTAKKAFLYTVIGAAILLGAWAIAQLISETVLQL